jgi:acyl carrier protein
MEEIILEILKRVFQLTIVDNTCSQLTCEKWDSLNHLNLIAELEDEFDVEFEPEEIAEMKSVEIIKKVISAKF